MRFRGRICYAHAMLYPKLSAADFCSKNNAKLMQNCIALIGQKGTIMEQYYINNNQTRNPGLHHEVHTKEHAEQLRISSKIYLGYFSSEVEAVQAGNRYYSDADGCAICCPKAHRG